VIDRREKLRQLALAAKADHLIRICCPSEVLALLNTIERMESALKRIAAEHVQEMVHAGYIDTGAGPESHWEYTPVPTRAAQLAIEALKGTE
jgi:hypothetical protein